MKLRNIIKTTVDIADGITNNFLMHTITRWLVFTMAYISFMHVCVEYGIPTDDFVKVTTLLMFFYVMSPLTAQIRRIYNRWYYKDE